MTAAYLMILFLWAWMVLLHYRCQRQFEEIERIVDILEKHLDKQHDIEVEAKEETNDG